MTTFDTLISTVITERAEQIKSYIALGWDKVDAIESVKSSSTLGAKSWTKVLELVEQE